MTFAQSTNTIIVETLTDIQDEDDGICTLREAIMAANTDDAYGGCTTGISSGVDIIEIPIPGILNLQSELPTINSSITIKGPGFAHLTIQLNSGIYHRVFTIESTAVISGVTISNGHAEQGSGIFNGGNLTLNSVVISNNTTIGDRGQGGGIYNQGTLSINNSTIGGNTASGTRGANGVDGSPAVNHGESGTQANGGGIYNAGTLILNNSTVRDNLALGGSGGHAGDGIIGDDPDPIIRFSGGNGGNGGGSFGGGIYNVGTVTLSNSTISGNRTQSGSGGNGGNGRIGGDGGDGGDSTGAGVFSMSGQIIVQNSTIYNNVVVAGDGGSFGIALPHSPIGFGDPGEPGVANGGGLSNIISIVRSKNSIIARNIADVGADCSGNLQSEGYNLIQNSSHCIIDGDITTNILGLDPLLDSLQDNGSDTATHAPTRLDQSPFLDIIPADNCPVTDQRGVSRPQGEACDIGAYESDDVQARVFYADEAAEGALIYRLPAGQSSNGKRAGNMLGTDSQGYSDLLRMADAGDTLVALMPIAPPLEIMKKYGDKLRLYYTNADPTILGVEADVINSKPALVPIAVSADSPLILFDLDVSLEWDARNEQAYLSALKEDISRASQILYDLTNGQMALGDITVYQNREHWLTSDIVIYATNNLRPNANLGGIVSGIYSETLKSGQVITKAYEPGQIRMGATWNRFGNTTGNLGEDWSRALAHELGHYLLFLLDNYLGLDEHGRLFSPECQFSAMTDAYRESFSEFLTDAQWMSDSECLKTLAENTTSRSDWATIRTYYPMLNSSKVLSGPNKLPIDVTEITLLEPESPVKTLTDPFFYLIDNEKRRVTIPRGQGQGYLYKIQNPEVLTDDYIIAVGSPNADLLQARGAEPGDRLCVFDYSQILDLAASNDGILRFGCLEEIGETASDLMLSDIPDWQPQLSVRPITSRTVTITVSNVISQSDLALNVQVIPAYPISETLPAMSPIAPMIADNRTGELIFHQTITMDHPTFLGYVRVWNPNSNPQAEAITQFFLSGDWGANFSGGAMANFSGGAMVNAIGWQAPAASSDGQVIIFNLDDIIGRTTIASLQAIATPPDLDPWLTSVGQAYHFITDEQSTYSLQFQYLQRDVPAGQEEGLQIYYYAEDNQLWEPLETHLDPYRNLASANIDNQGIYALLSTIKIPQLEQGWNNFGYTVPVSRTADIALASIDGKYTILYHFDEADTPNWTLYDPNLAVRHPQFAPAVNDLTYLEFGHGYWLNAIEPLTLFLGVAGSNRSDQPIHQKQFLLPPDIPATYFGWVQASDFFTPTDEMMVTARIGGIDCGATTIDSDMYPGQLFYKLQVEMSDSCGALGREINFEVGPVTVSQRAIWNNQQTNRLDLQLSQQSPPIIGVAYLPLVFNLSSVVTPMPTETPIPTGLDLPDLAIKNILLIDGSPATIQVVVENQGNTSVSHGNNFFVDFYVDRPPIANQAGDIAWSVQGSSFAKGAELVLSAPFVFSNNAHSVYAQIDTDNTVAELNETNNSFGPVLIETSTESSGNRMLRNPTDGLRPTPTPE
ncbi:MAG: choice-of-anchor Q domain-containing protein [Chloroflexota bacterium]